MPRLLTAAAIAATGVLLASCGGSSGASAGSQKEVGTAGPVQSSCAFGYLSATRHFIVSTHKEFAYQLTLHNTSAGTVLVRHLNVFFLIPGQAPWQSGNSVSNADVSTGAGASTGKIAAGETVSWVIDLPGSAGTRCALYDWSSALYGTYHKAHPWPPK